MNGGGFTFLQHWSNMLIKSPIWGRLDTVFFGSYEFLPKVDGVAPRSRMLPRTPEESILDSQTTDSGCRSIHKRLQEMAKYIRFGLDSGNMESYFDMPAVIRPRMGYTRHNLELRNIEIWIATEALQPL